MSTVNDPVRLVADPGCPESQRALLQHGANITPPRDAEARVWMALVASLGAAAAGGAAAADASTKTVTTGAGVKTGLASMKIAAIVAGVTALAAAVALASYVFSPTTHDRSGPGAAAPPPAVEAPEIAPPPPSPAAVEPPPADGPPPAGAPPARTAPGAHRSVRSPARRLGDETMLIKDARQALRAGDAARALRLLEESRRLFPSGVLQQERERLAIEALVKAGRAAEASARATAFLRKYPDSPHASEIRALGVGGVGGVRSSGGR
jgi:hypothetical protein